MSDAIADPRGKVWRILNEAMIDHDRASGSGKLCGHNVGLLTSDPPNLDALCGWESVITLKWLSTTGVYYRNHRVGLNIWARDDYTVSQVAACLIGLLGGHSCAGMASQFGGLQRDGEFYFGFVTIGWSE